MLLLVASSARAQFDVDLSGVEWTPELSAPVVIGASGCDKGILRVSLSGGLPGNEYLVWTAAPLPNGVFTPDLLGQFPVAPNADGITQADIYDPRLFGFDQITAQQVSSTRRASDFSPLFTV